MSREGGLLEAFAGAIAKMADVEEALRITLNVAEPIPREQQQEKGPYFTTRQISVPVKGLVFEELPFERKKSTVYWNETNFLTPAMFPHLPEDFEIFVSPSSRTEKTMPMARIKLSDGREFVVTEKFDWIQFQIEERRKVERQGAAQSIVGPIKLLLREELGLE